MRKIKYNSVKDQVQVYTSYSNLRIPVGSSSESLNIGSTVVAVATQFENVRALNNVWVPPSSRELSIPPENQENFQIDVMLCMQELSTKMNDQQKIIIKQQKLMEEQQKIMKEQNDQQKILIEQQKTMNEQYTAVEEKAETIKNNTSFVSALKISVCSSTLALGAAKLYEHPELVALGVKAVRVYVANHTKDFSDIDK